MAATPNETFHKNTQLWSPLRSSSPGWTGMPLMPRKTPRGTWLSEPTRAIARGCQLSARTEPQSGPGNQSADPLAGVSCSCSNCNIGQRSGRDALLWGRRKSIDSNAAGQELGDEDSHQAV